MIFITKISLMATSLSTARPHLTRDSYGPSEPTTQTDSRSVQALFGTDDHRMSLYFTMGCSFPPQNCPFPWGIWTPIMVPNWAHRVLNPNGISIGVAVFAGLTSVTDRQTDRQTNRPHYSVGNNIGRIYVGILPCSLKTLLSHTSHHHFEML